MTRASPTYRLTTLRITTRVYDTLASCFLPLLKRLERDVGAAFERQHLTRFGGRCDLERELFQDAAYFRNLLGIAFRKLAFREVDAVLEPHAHVAAHERAHGDEPHLMASRAEYRPQVLVAEKLVGRAFHVHQVFGLRTDAAE